MNRAAIIALSFAAGMAACAAASAAPMIGIVEETVQGDFAHRTRADVRLGFLKTDIGWAAIGCNASPKAGPQQWNGLAMTCEHFADPDRPRVWQVTAGGNNLGEITTRGWLDTGYYSYAGALRIVSGGVPFAGARDKNFSGWTGAPVHHPLVAVSPGLPPAGKRWIEDKPRSNLRDALWPQFHKFIPKIEVCKARKDAEPLSETRASRKSDLEVLNGLRSQSGEMLLHLRVNPAFSNDCDGTLGWQMEMWFYRAADGRLRVLPGQFADRNWTNPSTVLTPVDLGAYAGDGSEQAVFFLSAYNLDGYVLYYDHFTKFARVTWSYH